MADEPSTTESGSQEPASTPAENKTFTQEELDRIVSQRIEREKSKYADYDELKAAADKAKAEKQTDIERLTGERDELKGKAESASLENLRLRVALSKGLPSELIDRLKGSDQESLERDADELLKLVSAKPAGFNGGIRQTQKAPETQESWLASVLKS